MCRIFLQFLPVGDAILVVWRVNSETELQNTIDRVVQCCLDIQKHYGEWNTDIGITLTVKMGKRKVVLCLEKTIKGR